VARMGLHWNKIALLSLAASCVLGPMGCSDEDEPDPGPDAATDARRDTSLDTSVTPDVGSDRRDTGASDGGAPDGSCVGGGDAARDGAVGRAVVEALRCANCHQDEPVDAGLILSGRVTRAGDSGVYPKNLTPDPATGLGCWTDEQIINAVMNGLDERGQTLCTRMPRFGSTIDAGAAQEIVNFLRSIPAVRKEVPETTFCPPPVIPEPRPEGGTDAGPDGTPPEAGTDGTPPTDAGTDGTPPIDGDTDATPPDGGTDGAPPTDGGTDAAPDAAPDSAQPDAGPDAGLPDAVPDVDPDAGTDAADDAAADADPDGG
jgi:hypothetical protein